MEIRIVALCVVGAMLCALLRVSRPELATVVSLAIGCAVLAVLAEPFYSIFVHWSDMGSAFLNADREVLNTVVRASGIALLSELGSQLCTDAGERALAGRVTLAARVVILSLCAPLLSELFTALQELSL